MTTKKTAGKRTAKKAPAKKKTVRKTAPKKQKEMKPGAGYSCRVCGLMVKVDKVCGCVDYCDIICCGEQMKPA